MTTTAPTRKSTANQRVPMTSLRKSSLAAGVFYLITFVSIPVLTLYKPVSDPNFIVGGGQDYGVIIGCVLEIIVALAGIGTAVALYPVVKRQNQATALGFVGVRVLEASAIFVGVMSLLTLVTLRQANLGADAVITGRALEAFHGWTFLAQGLLPAVNAVLLGSLLYKSRLVPRILPTLGLIGAPLLAASSLATVFGLWDQTAPQSLLLTIPIAVWEFSLGVYLTVKGFKPCRITAEITAEETAEVSAVGARPTQQGATA